MENKEIFDKLCAKAIELGASNVGIVDVDKIETDAVFREMCASNACGVYGKCWTCPPDIGDIHELMAKVKSFDYALVYQTISDLEDSYDFEGMMEAGSRHNKLDCALRESVRAMELTKVLHLGAGGCRVCEVCAKRTNEPCRFPELAMSSLEAHGINVSKLAALAGMKYINGTDTVTYFGTVFFSV